MVIVPLTLAEARRFVADHHRHNEPPIGHRFSIGLRDDARRCIRCWQPVDLAALPDIDRREYAISALCPECFAAIFPEEDA